MELSLVKERLGSSRGDLQVCMIARKKIYNGVFFKPSCRLGNEKTGNDRNWFHHMAPKVFFSFKSISKSEIELPRINSRTMEEMTTLFKETEGKFVDPQSTLNHVIGNMMNQVNK